MVEEIRPPTNPKSGQTINTAYPSRRVGMSTKKRIVTHVLEGQQAVCGSRDSDSEPNFKDVRILVK